jgi:hypothetical protein
MRIAPYSTLAALHQVRIAPRLAACGRTEHELLRARHLAVRTEHRLLCVRHLAPCALLGLLLASHVVSCVDCSLLDTKCPALDTDRSVFQRFMLCNSLGSLRACYPAFVLDLDFSLFSTKCSVLEPFGRTYLPSRMKILRSTRN